MDNLSYMEAVFLVLGLLMFVSSLIVNQLSKKTQRIDYYITVGLVAVIYGYILFVDGLSKRVLIVALMTFVLISGLLIKRGRDLFAGKGDANKGGAGKERIVGSEKHDQP